MMNSHFLFDYFFQFFLEYKTTFILSQIPGWDRASYSTIFFQDKWEGGREFYFSCIKFYKADFPAINNSLKKILKNTMVQESFDTWEDDLRLPKLTDNASFEFDALVDLSSKVELRDTQGGNQ